ncbi:MAG: F0F1 ATP synthase subunit delta [Phycisphaerae bacterium]
MTQKQHIRREARRLFRFCFVEGMLQDAKVLQIAQAIRESAAHDRIALLKEFRRLVALEDVRRTATIQSATAISEELHASIQSNLERLYGKGLRMTFVEQPALIAGMRIKVGTHVFDGSMRGQLAALESRF